MSGDSHVRIRFDSLQTILWALKKTPSTWYFDMHSLFNTPHVGARGQRLGMDSAYVDRELERERDKIISYYRGSLFNVPSNHILVQIIQSLNLQSNVPYEQYVDNARAKTAQISLTFKLSSSASMGEVRRINDFYHPNVSEIIVSTTEDFDLEDSVHNWKDCESVRVLYHPYTDLNTPLPNGRYPDARKGYAVIAVNIPLLALQYRRWEEEERSRFSDAARTTMQFVQMYPVLNMVKSQLDIAIFNRLVAIVNGDAIAVNRNSHPFPVTDLTSKVDHYLDTLADALKNNAMTFPSYLLSIPMVSQATLYDVIRVPNDYFTRQNIWALTLARLPYFSFFIKLDEITGSKVNFMYYNRIIISVARIVNDNAIGTVVKGRVLVMTDTMVQTMIENMKR